MPLGVSDLPDRSPLNIPLTWDLCSDHFRHAAIELEKLSSKGKKEYSKHIDEYRKRHKLPKNEFIEAPNTPEINNALRNSGLIHIYPFLYYHALELSIKGMLLRHMDEKTFMKEIVGKGHKLSILFEKLRSKMGNQFPFDNNDTKAAKKILDQIHQVYYLFKYPYPNKEITTEMINDLTCKQEIQGTLYEHVSSSILPWLSMKSGDPKLNYLDVIKDILYRINRAKNQKTPSRSNIQEENNATT